MRLRNPNRYLRRLRASADPGEKLRIERVLATARVVLALLALVAIWLDSTEPTGYAPLAYLLLVTYLFYSGGVWALLRRVGNVRPGWILAVDLIFPTVFMLFTEGPNSPFFMFFVFVLTTAAFRWGFPETLLTSIAAAGLVSLEALALAVAPHVWHLRVEGTFDLNRYFIRTSYLVVISLLIGYMAEQDKLAQAENDVLRRMLEKARPDGGLRAAIFGIFTEMSQVFPCRRMEMVLQHEMTGSAFEWVFDPASPSLTFREVLQQERTSALQQRPPASAFYAESRPSGAAVWMLDAKGRRVRNASAVGVPNEDMLCITFTWGGEWNGRLLFAKARLGLDKVRELQFAQRMERQIGPAIYSVYLMRRLRSRAGAIERARVARELHDGAIQAMVGVEMQVEVLRRRASSDGNDPHLAAELERIRDLLREQTFDMRALMQQMKPLDLTPKQLLDFLADTVDRFRRDSGIAAQFVSDLAEVDLPPRMCREIARIAQEALINIRKHSGAKNVLVRFASSQGKCRLVVDDDGKGFDFVGRVSLDYLDSARKGPQVIKERVRHMGAELTIESTPGRGARLEITIPHARAMAAYV